MLEQYKYPTRRLIRCRECSQVFAAGPDSTSACPHCSSKAVEEYEGPLPETNSGKADEGETA